MYRCEVRREDPIFIHPKINGKDADFELDTGAALSCMGNKKFREDHPKVKVHKTNIKLKTFSGEIMEPVGVADVEVECEGKSTKLPIVITPGNTPSLLGRNWLKQLKIDWKRVFDVLKVENQDGRPEELGEVLEKHKAVFSEGLGKLKDYKVNIELKEFAKPRFCKARTVPYALRSRIEEELDRLVKEGIYVPVKYSPWAAPIVPVEKPDGGIRLCGDYKMTINPRAKCDNYPVPKTEDLLATISGGKRFTKLDLKQAYMQLELDEASQEYLTINTHKGLFKPTRLMFGVHSAAGVFQREIEKRLSGIPRTVVRSDDILITGDTEEEHLRNLIEVLIRLEECGLKLKLVKCRFFDKEVEWMGFLVNEEGVSPISEKIKPFWKHKFL